MLACVAGHFALLRTGTDTRKMNPCRIFSCAAALSLAASAAYAVAVSDGFPDQSAHHAATATSAAALVSFDSFAFADASAATPLTGFHSFVSQTATASPALTRFNSHEPAGFVFVIR